MDAQMSGLTSRLDRLWRMAMTGFCFALFGLGGLLLSLVWFNLLLLVQRDRAKRRQLARRSISASFRLFLGCTGLPLQQPRRAARGARLSGDS